MAGDASALTDLTARLLEREGAAIERIGPHALEVLAPAHVREALDLPDFGRLGFGVEAPPGGERVSLESDFVERLEAMLGRRGRTVRLAALSEGPGPASPDRLLEEVLILDNATYRLAGVERAYTTYAIATFRYVARSDDRREGLISFGLNVATASALDDVTPFIEAPKDPCGPVASDVPRLLPERLADVASRVLPPRIEERLEPFLAGMRRRLQRDVSRLLDYYGRLRAESLAKLDRLEARTDSEESGALARRETQRLESIAREHRTKLADLRERYALAIDVEWLQTLEIVARVHRFAIDVRRRKRTRRLHLDLNPFTRGIEPPPCEHGHALAGPRVVCDDALHLVSRPSHAPCPGCEKAFCRACHPAACPRCGCGT